MKFSILTLFPELIKVWTKTTVIGRALQSGNFQCDLINVRDFAKPPFYRVDDQPYGGGPGMVMTLEPLVKALRSIPDHKDAHTVLLSPTGTVWCQKSVGDWAKKHDHVIFVCGRYEGVDHRFHHYVDEVVSIGDYVLCGGDVAAMVMMESMVRCLPGVLGNAQSAVEESFQEGLLEGPVYTRPQEFEGHVVPAVLMGGHHVEIRKWRLTQSEKLTQESRPDLWKKYCEMKKGDE